MLQVTVQVIIPARNEEDCIGRCLESLVNQQGIGFQIIVVDDGSTDRTRLIAQREPGVRVISAPEPDAGISGKCNALIAGARDAGAKWLLLTDADTFHYPGSLAAAVKEAEEREVDMLSYSPEQETGSWYERALLPVVYAELARTYPPAQVNDPASSIVAANGQYILVRRATYEALGGHTAVAHKILEDVELARLFKVKSYRVWFCHGAGRVRTRMYRSFRGMCEGWTKNLVSLFPRPLRLAGVRALEFAAIVGFLVLSLLLAQKGLRLEAAGAVFPAVILYAVFLLRIRKAHFPWHANLMSFMGLPLFASLLVRSWLHSRVQGAITWKGRQYASSAAEPAVDSSIAKDI